MASLSLCPSLPPAFSNSSTLVPSIPSGHARRKSRSPNAASLPAFTFNPAAAPAAPPSPQPPLEKDTENQPPASDMTETLTISRRSSKPAPLPDFKFNPGADLPSDDRPSPTHPVLEEMALNQQRMSRSARPSPLPAFTFAPGAPAPQTTPSPSRTEFLDVHQNRPAAGHKRAGSEFVGGGGTDGPTMVSTSPSKHESRPSGPPVSMATRRGHAHRRSQAVSITDIETSDLIKAHAIAKTHRGSGPPSGPSTPLHTPDDFLARGSPPNKQSALNRSPPSSPNRRESANGPRPRVEFAEKIDVIPRPLSMISSETEGSCSTVRYSHSLSNSINSVASPPRTSSVIGSPSLDGIRLERPRTADATTMLRSTRSPMLDLRNEVGLPQRPLSAYASPTLSVTDSPVSKKKHFWFTGSPDRTPTATPKDEKLDPFASLPQFAPTLSSSTARPKTSPERSISLKKKKHHPFSGGIFSKKSKGRASKAKVKRVPTPPAVQRRASDQLNRIFDADDTIVLRSESPEVTRVKPRIITSNSTPPSYEFHEEITSPVLDLDIALGSLGSEDKLEAEMRTRSAAARIARLHSSERRGNVDAFGVHRRTESAPVMQAFNRSALAVSRHDSNPSLVEEVFDEEEEDIFLADEGKSTSPANEIDTDPATALENPEGPQIDGLGLSHLAEDRDEVIIVDPESDMALADEQSSNSTLGAPVLADADMMKRPMTSPMSFNCSGMQSHYASSTEGRTTTSASMISSPDAEHLYFDVARLTPTMSQQSPDFFLRPSNEDLPSLTDSISTGAIPRISSSANTRSSTDHRFDQRSRSMFVPGTSRSNQSWKRSSLASLNRLIPGSANGSRLKFETVPDATGEERSKKKAHRLSKLVNFWRTKDKAEKPR